MDLPVALYASLALVGLATGVHCLGMCGGIVTAFGTRQVAPLRDARRRTGWPRQLAFNAGRISSYAVAGAAAGALGALFAARLALPQLVLYVLANIVLVLVGLQLAGAGGVLARVEALGAPLWRRIAPHAGRLMGGDTLPRAYAAGTLWGWLPCGFVYGALTTATLAGGAASGALAMAAFGLGTLPWLLAAGVGAARLRGLFARPRWRAAIGFAVLGSGVFGLARAATLPDSQWIGFICL